MWGVRGYDGICSLKLLQSLTCGARWGPLDEVAVSFGALDMWHKVGTTCWGGDIHWSFWHVAQGGGHLMRWLLLVLMLHGLMDWAWFNWTQLSIAGLTKILNQTQHGLEINYKIIWTQKKKKNYRTSLLLLQPQGLGLDLNWLESFPDSSAHIKFGLIFFSDVFQFIAPVTSR